MRIEDIRRTNINLLVDLYEDRTQLAEALGYKDTIYINQLCGGHGSFGSNTARKIEQQLSLADGWMDVTHDHQVSESDSPAYGLEQPPKIQRIIKKLKQLNSEQIDTVLLMVTTLAKSNDSNE